MSGHGQYPHRGVLAEIQSRAPPDHLPAVVDSLAVLESPSASAGRPTIPPFAVHENAKAIPFGVTDNLTGVARLRRSRSGGGHRDRSSRPPSMRTHRVPRVSRDVAVTDDLTALVRWQHCSVHPASRDPRCPPLGVHENANTPLAGVEVTPATWSLLLTSATKLSPPTRVPRIHHPAERGP